MPVPGWNGLWVAGGVNGRGGGGMEGAGFTPPLRAQASLLSS